ncbi:xylose isomerase [Candidatus Bathyarchaeota archaeon RBG_13_52_12]|nr:MAG: xylose isomerase [Candidatus Bathyarchaeota archaeon RBG_13_52_12]
MLDLRPQKIEKTLEEMLKHLKGSKLRLRFSIGVWYFYPGGGRFHDAYIEKGTIEDCIEKIKEMKDDGVIDGSLGVEAHYPNEVNWENIHIYKGLEKETGIRLITCIPMLFFDKQFEFGSLSNPDAKVRKFAIDRLKDSLKLNKELGTDVCVIWPGIDGYENPFGHDYYGMWSRFESAVAEAIDEVPAMRVAMEPKPYEPRGNNIYRNTANGLLFARNVEALLRHRENLRLLKEGHAMVGLNPEVGHVLMGHEDLPGAFASVLREGRLAHSHWNSQPLGNYDQDLNVGVLGIDQMLATLLVFKMYDYTGFFGIDINPERIPVDKAIALNVNALNAGAEVVNNLDYETLVEAMSDPAGHRGAIEETLTKAWAPKDTKLKRISH